MKLKLLSFLLILLVLAACRNDHLQDLHNREENTKNQLVSKIISLNESAHKHKLLPQLKEAKEKIKTTMPKNIFGKMVSFGDSISIDTEQVAYIEYKAYHTYTFRIIRNEAEENAPVENLILSLEPDGTYKELIKTYYLSPEDIENISIGNGFDPSGKSQTIEIAKGTFLSKTSCRYESQTVWQDCRSTQHNRNNITDWHKCEYSGNDAPRVYTIEVFICEEDSPAPGGWDPAEFPVISYGGGSPLSGHSNPNPNPNPGPDPSAVEEAQNELGGIITLPNILPNPKNNPCAKIKVAFADEKFKAKFDILTDPAVFDEDHETAFVMKHPPIGTTGVAPAFISIDMPPCSTGDSDAVWPNNFAGITVIMHNHNNEDCNGNTPVKAPSPVDIRTFINKLLPQANTFTGSYTGAMSLVTTSGGNYMLMYEGTNYPGSINAIELKKLNDEYKRDFQILYQRKANVTQSDIEKVFTRFLKEKINKLGLGVYRVTKTSAVKIEYDPASPNSVKETACP